MTTIIFNGKTLPSDHPCIKHSDRGFTLGHGLFETILIKKGTIPLLEYHWHRLETSAPLVGISLPFSKQELTEMLRALISENNLQDNLASARLTLTHGESARGILPATPPSPNFVIAVFEYAHAPKAYYSALITTIRKNEHTLAARVKSISYLDNILAKQEALSQGYDEAILLNTALKVADGAITNIFMVKSSNIYTPPIADGALPGVVRRILLEELKTKFPIREKSITYDELLSADEVFLTNALMGIQPLSQINNKKYQGFSTSLGIAEWLKEVKNYI